MGKLITLITLKMYINKILYLLCFICFLFHVNMFVVFELWHFKVFVVKIIIKLVRYPFWKIINIPSLSSLTLHFHALHLQSYKNHVKEISGTFKDPASVDLAVLKKIVNFWRFQNSSMNLLGITSEKVDFLFPK